MPTVPQYGDDRVQLRPLPEVRAIPSAPIEAFGGGRSAAVPFEQVRELSRDSAEMALRQADDAHRLRMSQLDREVFEEWERPAIDDPKTGAVNRRGQSAFGVGEDLDKSLAKYAQEKSRTLANDRQRASFGELIARRRQQVLQWADRHEVREMRTFEEGEHAAGIESSKERAVLRGDPETIGEELSKIRFRVGSLGTLHGWGPEVTQAELRKQESDLHYRVLRQMLGGQNPRDAAAYFDGVKDKLEDGARQQIGKALEDAGDDDLALRIERDVFMPPNPKDGPPINRGDALGRAAAELHKLKRGEDAKLRDDVMRRVKLRWADEEGGRKLQVDQLYEGFAKDVAAGRDPRRKDPVGYQQLPQNLRDALRDRMEEQRDDGPVWMDFLEIYRNNPDDVARMSRADFDLYWSKMKPAHRQRAEAMWMDALESARKGAETDSQSSRVGIQKEIERQAKRADILPWTQDGLKPDEKAAYAEKFSRFEESVEEALREFQLGTKDRRRASPEEAREIIKAELAKEVFVDGDPRRIPTLSAEERRRATIPDKELIATWGWPHPRYYLKYSTAANRVNSRRAARGKPALKPDDPIMEAKVGRLAAAEKMRDFDLYESILDEVD